MLDIIIWTSGLAGGALLLCCGSMLLLSIRHEWEEAGYAICARGLLEDVGYVVLSTTNRDHPLVRGRRARPASTRPQLIAPRRSLATYPALDGHGIGTPSWQA